MSFFIFYFIFCSAVFIKRTEALKSRWNYEKIIFFGAIHLSAGNFTVNLRLSTEELPYFVEENHFLKVHI